MNESARGPTRRQLLATGSLAVGIASVSESLASTMSDKVKDDLEHYIGLGIKASGGPGDNACGEWLASELQAQGFKVTRQTISVPFFEPSRAELTMRDRTVPIIPQAIVVGTGPDGVSGPLVHIDPTVPSGEPLNGAIALIDLPYARRSSALDKQIQTSVKAAIEKGAHAAVIITNGPTRKAVALNTDGSKPLFNIPTAVMAPEHAAPFLAATAKRETGTLYLTGRGGRRDAVNLAGRLDRGRSKWIVVSTPRSGWFTCAGERGPGVAIWLALARWAPKALGGFNFAFVCNSAHEYEYLGAEKSLQAIAPRPLETAMWLALGAGIAARDWHELPPHLLPLPSADPQRFLVTSPDILETARHAFAGQPGIEAPYPTTAFTAGELAPIHGAGYNPLAGFFGIHRYHHAQDDDERCIAVEPTRQVIEACQSLLNSVAMR